MPYIAPQTDMQHILTHILDIDEIIDAGLTQDLDTDLLSAILDEAGKFASDQLAPLNKIGDKQGTTLTSGAVNTPDGWQDAYTQWQEAGWAALAAPTELGGQALPHMVAQCVGEFWNSANLAFGLCPLLTQGAVDAIHQHGSEDLKATYLPKMISGEWTGTMNLTEPQAGSDLSVITAKAIPQDDGSHRISGTKIFITYGEHDLTENIIHLVLARLPDAPKGTKGISLFLVPKYLINKDGTLGERNDLLCTGLEHKLGIHASPTCVMSFGNEEGAVGYLVGEENRGLNAMFTMMNLARLSVGTQGVAIMERSTQQALDYAGERRQGKAHSSPKNTMDPIIKHPDIRANLSLMQATIQACRAICLATAKQIDLSERAKTTAEREKAANMAALLTPIAKAFPTDCSLTVTSLGVQIHGGMGFIEETGSAQHFRDARILPIYEGTNGIQAIDLMFRKLPLEGGNTIKQLINEIATINQSIKSEPSLANTVGNALSDASNDLTDCLNFFDQLGTNDPTSHLYAATPFLKLMGLTLGCALLIKGAISATKANSPDHKRQTALAAIFAQHLSPETKSLKHRIIHASTITQDLTKQLLKN